MIIKKKTWPEYFQKILDGDKTFDLRLADFDIKVGDTLLLEEYDPKTQHYTGRKIKKVITYVGKTKDWQFFKQEDIDKYGYIVMSFK